METMDTKENIWLDLKFDPFDPTNIWRRNSTIVDLIPYAHRTHNKLMMKKALQYFNFDHQDSETKVNALTCAAHFQQYEWVEMLLNGMEKQGQRFNSVTMHNTICYAIKGDAEAITKRLLQHEIIPKSEWKKLGECAMSNSSERLLRVVLDCSQCDPVPEQADLNELLHFAARIGHVPSIALLSRRGADVNMPSRDFAWSRFTAPIIAAQEGKMEAAVWMFRHGAYIDIRKVKKILIKKPANRYLWELYSSISRQPEICQRACCDLPRLTRELYAGHCDSSSSPPSYEGLQPGSGFGLEARQFDRYIISLAFTESSETISLLLDKVDVPKMGQEILFRASYWRGNRLLIKELLARGVSLAAKREENNILHSLAYGMFDWCDKKQRKHMIDAVNFILDVRPETLSERDKVGNTPLHIASTNNLHLVDALLKRGASADAINDAGQKPHKLTEPWWDV